VVPPRSIHLAAVRGAVLIAGIAIALYLSDCGERDSASRELAASVTAKVTRVIDGDTIVVGLPGGDTDDVRYIGIDTPETVKPGTPVQCGGRKAHAVNERLVDGRTVTLRFDEERRDVYGRLLAYVYVADSRSGGRPLFVNAELARRGLARTLTIRPNDSFAPLFARLAHHAGVEGRGLWGRCPL
jgi:micrococcal nuclease